MIAMGNAKKIEMHENFLNFWKDKPVYAYVKSQDNRWLFEQDQDIQNKSHYAKQYCEYPWTSLTVMAEGKVAPCTQISNNEIILGNLKDSTLEKFGTVSNMTNLEKCILLAIFQKGHKCKKIAIR